MMEPKQCAEAWKTVCCIYESTINENNPEVTMNKIIETLGFDVTKETFATVSAIKKHDDRIYGSNREYMDSIPVNPDSIKHEYGNPMIYAGLDDIHTSHINNLITKLRLSDPEWKKQQEILKNEKSALEYAEEHGILSYKIKGNCMIYYANYPAYLSEPRYTIKVTVHLDSLKEERKRLARWNKLGNENMYK